MITIEKLRERGFFEAIPRIKELGYSNGIKDIYVIQPIISSDTLYFMVTNNKGACNFENLFKFSNSVAAIFDTKFDIHVYKKNALLEAIDEGSAFSKKYQNALDASILIDNLDENTALNLQWDRQNQRTKENKSETKKQKVEPIDINQCHLFVYQTKQEKKHTFSQKKLEKTNNNLEHQMSRAAKRARMTIPT